MPIRVFIYSPRPKGAGVIIYSFGVGFCVARYTMMGNARAMNSGTSDRYCCPAFFVSMATKLLRLICYRLAVGQ